MAIEFVCLFVCCCFGGDLVQFWCPKYLLFPCLVRGWCGGGGGEGRGLGGEPASVQFRPATF